MPKNIVVCSDGTGNTAVKGRGSNVFRLFESIDTNGFRTRAECPLQVAIYDDGVGTEDLKWLRILGGAFGWGLSRNVKQLYTAICRVYQPGDRIYLFGFSRGAFTVRTLAGLIADSGLLDPHHFPTSAQLDAAVRAVYKSYRRKYQTVGSRLLRGERKAEPLAHEHAAQLFRDPEHLPDGRPRIAFLGVWDTVDAVGLPFRAADAINAVIWRFKFKDQRLSDQVLTARHALALDDKRRSFWPVMWEPDPPRIKQVWFAGAHSNVGGGYPRQGMSLVALDWMMEEAEQAGLCFVAEDRQYYATHHAVEDKLYDPRAGMGIFYRWQPRDPRRFWGMHEERPRLHISVLERITRGTEGYAPLSVPPECDVEVTGIPTASQQEKLSDVQGILNRHKCWLVDSTRNWIRLGRSSYALFIGVTALAFAITFYGAWIDTAPMGFVDRLKWIPSDGPIEALKEVATNPRIGWPTAAGLALAALMSLVSDRRIAAHCSQYWHSLRPELRRALGI